LDLSNDTCPPELKRAFGELVAKLSHQLSTGRNVPTQPVQMYVAGGVAVAAYTGSRYTEDVDAHFSRRVALDQSMVVPFTRGDGSKDLLHFDTAYNTSFALLHDGFEEDAWYWRGFEGVAPMIEVRLLAPLDLAVSKTARYGEQDVEDIERLYQAQYFSLGQLVGRATEALDYFVGNMARVENSIRLIAERLGKLGTS
jgi:hypothetical protein